MDRLDRVADLLFSVFVIAFSVVATLLLLAVIAWLGMFVIGGLT